MEERIQKATEGETDKVEKGLIKNLVIGYLTAPNNGKSQILKLISAVLEFTPDEANKTGVNKSQGGWLGGLLHSGGGAAAENEGLAQAFVKFLEQESRPVDPGTGPALLNMMGTKPGAPPNRSGEVVNVSTTSPTQVVLPHPIPMMAADATMEQSLIHTRNSSSILKDVLNDS